MDARKKLEALERIRKELHPSTQEFVIDAVMQEKYGKLTPDNERIIHDLYPVYFDSQNVRIRKVLQ